MSEQQLPPGVYVLMVKFLRGSLMGHSVVPVEEAHSLGSLSQWIPRNERGPWFLIEI